MPEYRVTAKLLVVADNPVAALEAAAAVIEHHDPETRRYHCTTGLIAGEVELELVQPRPQAKGA